MEYKYLVIFENGEEETELTYCKNENELFERLDELSNEYDVIYSNQINVLEIFGKIDWVDFYNKMK